jgi:hypothetical protein
VSLAKYATTSKVVVLGMLMLNIVALGAPAKVCQYPLARVVTLQPRKFTEPTIRRRTTRDGYVIENPLPDPVVVTLSCGVEWEPISVDVRANNWELVEVVDKNGKSWDLCFISKWRKK